MKAPEGNRSEQSPHDNGTLGRIELAVAQLLRRADRTAATHQPLDRSAYLLLRELTRTGPATVSTLAERLGLDGSTVTRQIVTLERSGNIQRSQHPDDRRAVIITITDAGTRTLANNRTQRAELYADILDHWSPTDMTALADLLERLNDDLDTHRRATEHE